MHVTGDLGFSSLVLVVCVVFPVIGFVIRRKWRLAVARGEDIKRLLVLASEEAARAELEAYGGYAATTTTNAVSVPVTRNYQCAVCYCPTTTRCARCKAVRYCSGKCQIIHWRQGHKEECHPPRNSHQNNDEGEDSGQYVARPNRYEIDADGFEIEGKQQQQQHTTPLETSGEEPALSNPSSFPEVTLGKDDDNKVEFHNDSEGVNSASECSSTSFSGFSTSPSSGESSDDNSVCESISSNEIGRSDGPLAADISLDMLDPPSNVNDVDRTKPLSPKFASLVDSVDDFKLNKLNQIKPGIYGTTTSSSGLASSAFESTSSMSSGFWGRTLESIQSRNNDSAPSNSDENSKSKLSDSASSLCFSFNLLGRTSSPSPAQGSEVKFIKSDDNLPAASGHNKPNYGVALSENVGIDATKVRKSASLNCDRSNPTEKGFSSDSGISKSAEIKSSSSPTNFHPRSSVKGDSVKADASCVSSLLSSSSERSKHAIDDPGSISHLFKSREHGCLSSNASDAHLSSSVGVHSVSGVKSGKVDVAEDIESCPLNGRNGSKISVWKVVDQFRGSKLSKHNPSESGNETAGRYSDKGLFPYESFVKLYTWNKVELQPCGFINCGNSCYANAVLQCLAFTPPLTAYFLQKLHSKACVKKEWCFTCEFESLILKAKEGKSPLSPSVILSQLPNIGSQLGNGREEDAHEFLRYAVDTMQSVCLAGVNVSGSSEEETTLIGFTFGGYLRSKIRCMKCHGKSERHERMMDLTVEIEGDIGTLEEALRKFTGTEILDGENKYQCSRCKSYEKAKKKLTILEAPNVLTIALKRFQSGKFGKLNKSIQFPEILNLAPYMSGTSDKSPVYRLYAVIVHLDIMNAAFSGHYVCYVKNMRNKWFKVDDNMVTAVELGTVLTRGAYMLLYARCSPRAPKLIRNGIMTPDLKFKAIPSRINGKSTSMPRASSLQPGVVQSYPSLVSSDAPGNIESFYSKFHRLQKILEEDSSDSSSLLSSNSDEGSCSTDSNRGSSSADDLSDYIFGDAIRGWNSPWRTTSDSDTSSSSSSSPSYTRHSPLANLDRYSSGSPEGSGSHTGLTNSAMERDGLWDTEPGGSRRTDLESDSFLHSDTTKHCRKLASSSSSYRETGSQRLGWVNPFNDVKPNLPFRKSMRERTD
ncbi:UCH domain-containing protein/zf-MYND domain-containing protein [Cephalotus follicularis]|uniref:ubiquitinyl hydrolase 1 n=1 Tax=Cephalotus follicularis TaxID=3775 RepID=A0A1Q3BG36_CEPFO|nr:UCH domain-containing protein/zf-MYND domain-containing protein [Cephalotus follicularis]